MKVVQKSSENSSVGCLLVAGRQAPLDTTQYKKR